MAENETGKKKVRKSHRLRNRLFLIITLLLCAAVVTVLTNKIYRIYGAAMLPNLSEGDVVIAVKDSSPGQGDVIAIKYNNKILIRRVIAVAGDEVDMDSGGNVFINQRMLQEPYLTGKSLENCDIDLPHKVAEGSVFVMGDNRALALDSRQSKIADIPVENVLGKVAVRIWPFKRIGLVR